MEAKTQNTTGTNGDGQLPMFQLTLDHTFERITNPVISPGNEKNRRACIEQKNILQRKAQWTVTDAVRWAFYTLEGEATTKDGEAGVDQSLQEQLVAQAAAVLTACLAKVRRVTPEQLYVMFGVKPGSSEAEVLAARQCAIGIQEELSKLRADTDLEIAAQGLEIQQLNQVISDMRLEKQALETMNLEQMQEIQKLRAELQTAQATPAVVGESKEVVDVIRGRYETAIETIKTQSERIRQLEAASKTKVDAEILRVINYLHKHLPETQETIEVKLAVFFLMNNLEATQ